MLPYLDMCEEIRYFRYHRNDREVVYGIEEEKYGLLNFRGFVP